MSHRYDYVIAELGKRIEAYHSNMDKQAKEYDRLKIELSNYAYQIDRAKQERDKAESENERLKSELELQLRNIQAVKKLLNRAINEKRELKSELNKAKQILSDYICYGYSRINTDQIIDFLKDKS